MKKYNIILILFCSYLFSFSQGVIETSRMANEETSGTARSIAMGGAFGALGGDISGIKINPAGLAVYRSSEMVGTLNFEKVQINKNSTNSFNINNFGIVGYIPMSNSDFFSNINFSFTSNRSKSFNREYKSEGVNQSSLLEFISTYSNMMGLTHTDIAIVDGSYDPFRSGMPWLSVLGYGGYLMDWVEDKGTKKNDFIPIWENGIDNRLTVKEWGSVNNYDFSVATAINSINLNLGFSLMINRFSYNMKSSYQEYNGDDFFDLRNPTFEIHGNGIGFKAGAIFRPINAIRVGVSYESPVTYAVRNRYEAVLLHNVATYWSDKPKINYKSDAKIGLGSDIDDWEYNMRTPGKITFSVASIIASKMILSLDYEITNNKQMGLLDPYNDDIFSNGDSYRWHNEFMKSEYIQSHSLRAGLEFRVDKQLSLRAGYAFIPSPFKDNGYFKSGKISPKGLGSIPNYSIQNDANIFSGGLGYRLSREVYIDVAGTYTVRKDEAYAFPKSLISDNMEEYERFDLSPYKLDYSKLKLMVTLGYKF